MDTFKAKIGIIGINPFVFLPQRVLNSIFKQAGVQKGPIRVTGTIEGHPFKQTLVRYSGAWRLYINRGMLNDADKKVGDTTLISLNFDPEIRTEIMHPRLKAALKKDKKAQSTFQSLSPSRQKEIIRYINNLKQETSIDRNVSKIVGYLTGKNKFAGRDKP